MTLKTHFILTKYLNIILSTFKIVMVKCVFYFLLLISNSISSQTIINGDFENNTLNWQEEFNMYCFLYGKSDNKIPGIYNWACNTSARDRNPDPFQLLISKVNYTFAGISNPHQNRNTHFQAYRFRQVLSLNIDSFSENQHIWRNKFTLALQFSKPLIIGKTYKFKYLSAIGVQNDEIVNDMDSSRNRKYSVLRLKVGISENNSSFGDSVGVTNAWIIPNKWQKHHFTFIAHKAANFVTFDYSNLTIHNPQNYFTYSEGISCTFHNKVCEKIVRSYCLFDNFEIEEACQLELGNDTTLCEGESMILNAKNIGSRYLWSTGDTTQTIDVSKAGKYWVNINNKGCINFDTIVIKAGPKKSGFLGKDTVVCNGKPIELNSNLLGIHQWSNGLNDTSIIVSEGGIYNVMVNNNGCVNMDTINIVMNSQIDLGEDTTLCENEALVLKNRTTLPFEWSTSEISKNIIVKNSNAYWLKIYENGCFNIDTIKVNFQPINQNFLGEDKSLCYNENMLLSSNIIGNYLWNTGSKDSILLITQPGVYSLTVKDKYCIHYDSINVNQELKTKVDFPLNITVCKDSLFSLKTILPNAKWWNSYNDLISDNGQLNITVHGPETFYVSSGYNCKYMDSLVLKTQFCNPINWNFYFPNAFTPNQNPPNEVYNPQADGWQRQEMQIFNRWGEMVFYTNDESLAWDGTYQRKISPDGLYIVKLKFKALDNATQTNPYYYWHGTIHLLR